MSPSEEVKFSNVRGLYLRKYGIYLPPTLFKNTPSRYLIKQIFYEKAELLTYSTSIFSVYSTVADMDGTFDKGYISGSVQ